MEFSSLKTIQDWKVDRQLFRALAKAHNTTTSKLELVVGDIDVTTDKIGAAIGLPSIDKSFPEEEEWTSEQERSVAPFKSVRSPWLQEVLHSRECNVSTSNGRRLLWHQEVIPIVDVENITRYNWTRFVHDELMKGDIVTLLVKQGVVDAKFVKNITRASTSLAKKRGRGRMSLIKMITQ
ncbi:uncharacterized protein DS421_20g705810 [Arachis hypogaea]|nr:uncharacterized protein DS421_20g705810 [Arachis hypogaea]